MTAKDVSTIHVQDQRTRKAAVTDLPAPGILAKWPIIGLIMFVFGALAFGGLTYNLLNQGPLLQWDREIANTLPAIGLKSPTYVRTIMDAGFYIGDQVIAGLSILLGLLFIIKRLWKEVAMLVIGMVGASSLFLFLSHLINRPRPSTQIWIVLGIPGYPSGHAISVIVFYGLMAYLLVPRIASAFWRVVVVVVALLIIGFVGFSRIFTGGHYLTDILAGYAIGIAWSGIAFTCIEVVSLKIRSRNVKKEQTYSS